jgi:hypothetical protein
MPGKTLRWFSIRVLTFAALLCAMPLSFEWSQGSSERLLLGLSSATAADLSVPIRYHRRHRHLTVYGRLYDPFCGGPYVGGGYNGGTYWGGPWMDLRCYGIVN